MADIAEIPLGSLRDGMATNKPLSPLTTRRSCTTKASSMTMLAIAQTLFMATDECDFRDVHAIPSSAVKAASDGRAPTRPQNCFT